MTDRPEAAEAKIAGNTGESSAIAPSGMEMSQFSAVREQMTSDQSASVLPSLEITGLESQETLGTTGDTSPAGGTMSDASQSARDDGASKELEGQAPGSEAPNPSDNGSASQGADSNEGNMGPDAAEPEPPVDGPDDGVPPAAADSAAMQTTQDHVKGQENEMKLPEDFHQPTQQFDNQQIPRPFESNGFGGTPESL